MSKICFIGDCHLGFRHRMKVQRLKDYTNSFLEALELAELSGPAAIVFTGDVFHHVRPDPKTMHTLITRVLELAREIPLIFCIGNHDIETHLGSSYIPLISELHENIHVLTTQKHQVILSIEGKKVGFYGFQYIRSKKLAEETLEAIMPEAGVSEYNILCLHQAVEGYLEPHELSIRALREVASKYDLMVFGHVHKHQGIRELEDLVPAYYVGSTERTSFNEAENENGFMTLENFDFKNPVFTRVNSASMAVVRKDLGKKPPSEINAEIHNLIKANPSVKCLQASVKTIVDGDYFEVCHEWDALYPEFTILDVSIKPVFDEDKKNMQRLTLEGDFFEEYFEHIGVDKDSQLRVLCKEFYKQYGN